MTSRMGAVEEGCLVADTQDLQKIFVDHLLIIRVVIGEKVLK